MLARVLFLPFGLWSTLRLFSSRNMTAKVGGSFSILGNDDLCTFNLWMRRGRETSRCDSFVYACFCSEIQLNIISDLRFDARTDLIK